MCNHSRTWKVIKKKKKEYNKLVFWGNSKSNTIKVLISNALIDSYITHDKFVSVDNVLRESSEIKKK